MQHIQFLLFRQARRGQNGVDYQAIARDRQLRKQQAATRTYRFLPGLATRLARGRDVGGGRRRRHGHPAPPANPAARTESRRDLPARNRPRPAGPASAAADGDRARRGRGEIWQATGSGLGSGREGFGGIRASAPAPEIIFGPRPRLPLLIFGACFVPLPSLVAGLCGVRPFLLSFLGLLLQCCCCVVAVARLVCWWFRFFTATAHSLVRFGFGSSGVIRRLGCPPHGKHGVQTWLSSLLSFLLFWQLAPCYSGAFLFTNTQSLCVIHVERNTRSR